jgi:hypothetical protein
MERAFYHLGSELTIKESMELSVTMVNWDGESPELSGGAAREVDRAASVSGGGWRDLEPDTLLSIFLKVRLIGRLTRAATRGR